MFVCVFISAFLTTNNFTTNKREFTKFGRSMSPLGVVPDSYFEFLTSVDQQCCHKELNVHKTKQSLNLTGRKRDIPYRHSR